ncbi:MAG: hypothetical protein OXC07_07290, partial [Kistimonas sp.]|nr:hypothetical protein [Kistimonas sp.]
PLLTHLLREQEQEQEHGLTDSRQASQPPPPAPATPDLLASLVHYGLSQQLTQAHQLRLRPSPLDWPAAAEIKAYHFSPCSRWLVFVCKAQTASSLHLRLYGWEQGVWQRCQMVTDVVGPVTFSTFTTVPPDTLISVHGVNVLAWNKTQDSTTWHSTLVCHIPQSYKVCDLYSMTDGDQIIVAINTRKERAVLRVLFCRHTPDGKGWKTTRIQNYDVACSLGMAMAWDAQPQSYQLVLTTSTWIEGSENRVTEAHIWRKGRVGSQLGQWEVHRSRLPRHDSSPNDVIHSPDGHYLLGALSNGQACLWALDAQYRLQEQLITDCLYQPEWGLELQASFRRDGKQLALSRSCCQVQLFDCDSNGHWQQGPLLEAPPVPHVPGDNAAITMQLSASGRTLVRQTAWGLDIWHQTPAASWQHFVQYRKEEGHRFPPRYCLLQPGELVCTTTQDPEKTLRVYGPDSRGQFVRKAHMPITKDIYGVSPDGLSLVLGYTRTAPTVLQLASSSQEGRCSFL